MLLMKKILCLLTVAVVSGCASVKTVSVKLTEPRPAVPINGAEPAI